ncbi:chromosomal replication initiator protein DnaA [Olsenella sp. YH-ols2217]|uniref:Chromosomal replication initiator protein DnaA n=1 Tax=Kribbibacterium absianum TaxID=3044210 RepID=A0ABT6ZK02_9ACTN|nr:MULTISPECIES: chromosomal replication initiator protein DnaA [unclassified Olsenella]MDJ1122795.1 chromosomal replication initiator protein DnaA [Olsenella sp. YH-ols2216]MDJ1129222.1 chromosomal replication initiator protein DnaA [Olsenella sp. YH-ols2217]
MDVSASDAQLLWDDACLALEAGEFEQLAKMARAATPVVLEGGALTVTPPSGFAARVLQREAATVEKALSDAAFEPVALVLSDGAAPRPAERVESAPVPTPVEPAHHTASPAASATPDPATRMVVAGKPQRVDGAATSMTLEEFRAYQRAVQGGGAKPPAAEPQPAAKPASSFPNPLIERIAAKDATLTFDTFVEADENRFALQAAKQVANGVSDQYNPLFIHGSSGLGKTHLLRAIQNYIAENDPERTCAYRIATDFIGDYTNAIKDREHGMMEALERNYHDIDVLILDDVQHLKGATKTIEFFFNTFNYLISHGKQIVLAADEPPGQLGMPERITSRMSQGLSVAVQSPTLEFKRVLIETFYERMKAEGGIGSEGTLTPDDLTLMADRAGGNIRSIRSFVQDCLFRASHLEAAGSRIESADIIAAAAERWANEGKRVTVEDIQRMVQNQYGISRQDLVGTKRSKEIAQPRHIAIWLCRELTDQTLAEIGKHFGGRSHATVKHSIAWVEQAMEEDRVLFDRLVIMRERLGGS